MSKVRRSSWQVCLIAVAASIPSLSATEPIVWSADRPLRWEDFAGRAPTSVPPEVVAMTAASLGWGYAYEIEQTGGSCLYWITDITAQAAFHQEQSWSKSEHRTDAVLAHEQGHFDIAQIHKQMFDQESWELLGTARRCSGRNADQIEKSVGREIGKLLGSIYEDVWNNQESVQAAYDEQTRHGTDTSAQQRWLGMIAAALRNGNWRQPGSVLP